MMDLDRWQEVIQGLTRHRFRSAVTAMSVAWGIFMLVLLLGAGQGLQNNVAWQFRDDAVNSIWLYSGATSKPYQGLNPNRRIQFTNEDFDALVGRVPGIEHITGRFYLRGEFSISHGQRRSAFSVRSCHPGHRFIENTVIDQGRFLNPRDLSLKRKVAVIGVKVAEFLFPRGGAVGEEIDIAGIVYTVVGVFSDTGGDREQSQVYIPISTAQAAYKGGNTIHQLMFTVDVDDPVASARIADNALAVLAERHRFDPEDTAAVRVRNNLERFAEITTVFTWLRGFTWIVGAGTVLAGVVGVSNVMLISVKERTREIGLRKALGATPGSLVGMVLQESVTLTAVSGYIGLVAGVALLEGVRRFVPENDYIRDPSVDIGAAIGAALFLVFCGALAGWFPARRAARVAPIVALRDE